jgi:hypothetical protein
MNVYIAAPYEDSQLVREHHILLRDLRMTPTSQWAEDAQDGTEDLRQLSPRVARVRAFRNDLDLRSAHVVVVFARDGAGGEMFAEARLALENNIPVIWAGERRTLSAYRDGVIRVDSLGDAFRVLKAMAVYVDGTGVPSVE